MIRIESILTVDSRDGQNARAALNSCL